MPRAARSAAPTDDDLPPPARRPFDVNVALRRIARAVQPYAPAAMFALKEGDDAHPPYATLFQQLVACILSIRTYDEVSLPLARRLFARADSPAAIAALSIKELDALIAESTFHEAKARQIHALAARTATEFGGTLPPDAEILTSFAGVGPKCAHLALGVAAGVPLISVDIHVHRVTNRWGYVAASTPERTLAALEEVLPKRHWIGINRLLVPFGKHVCTGVRPKCSTCPVLDMCARVGVTSHR
ncbi:endonuclease III domain-containing protein [Roseisolibacter agri]|uniref:Endonuclease III n=1 Tax=Roseisolibacter agri TaxID=2014610 RepID=A0AA37VEP7_9BACT|nr:endonuclease III [Roseisolibacter agri]GLC25544.1 endonuclease III [Roseisolibacter agri]